jgi:hypothetical protein
MRVFSLSWEEIHYFAHISMSRDVFASRFLRGAALKTRFSPMNDRSSTDFQNAQNKKA